MLVITRRPKELLKIGDNITITVLRTTDYQVYIGIEAPPDVKIWRNEIYERIHASGDGVADDRQAIKDGAPIKKGTPIKGTITLKGRRK